MKKLEKILRSGKQIAGRIGLGALLLAAPIAVTGCSEEDDGTSVPNTENVNNPEQDTEAPYYPTQMARNGDLISSTNDVFFSTNYVGLANFGMHPRTFYDARWLVGQNGFQIYGGHDGGYGDTFQVWSKQEGIYACWAYGGLDNVILFGNWKGRVYEGDIRLGDPKDKFLAAFPNARPIDEEPMYVHDFLEHNIGGNLRSLATSFLVRDYTNNHFRVKQALIADIGDGLIKSIRISEIFEDY